MVNRKCFLRRLKESHKNKILTDFVCEVPEVTCQTTERRVGSPA